MSGAGDADGGGSFVMPGGKVDPDALREAYERAQREGDDGGLFRVSFEISRDLSKRVDRYLTDRVTFMSRTQLRRVIDEGGVLVNGRAVRASTKIKRGDVVEVSLPPPPATDIQGEDIPLDVVHEDGALIVLNKQPGLIVHPARTHNKGTLLNALVHHFAHRSEVGGGLSEVGGEFARPGVIHRLDRWTSGVMVVGKDDEAHWRLARQFERREVEKRYLALVHGVYDADADVIDVPIGPHFSRAKGMREKMVVRHDEGGKPAVTIARVRERFEGFTLMELELKTGRTHQIRVHMMHRGFPLVGDDMYGGRVLRGESVARELGEDVLLGRQALHAATLGFRHPRSSEAVSFTAALWSDMGRVVKLLREHRAGAGVVDVPGVAVDLDAAMRYRDGVVGEGP